MQTQLVKHVISGCRPEALPDIEGLVSIKSAVVSCHQIDRCKQPRTSSTTAQEGVDEVMDDA
jgi:hypothetical protein